MALAGGSFALGSRHGLDWDHIAAITDLTTPRAQDRAHEHARRGTGLAFWYCTGHGLVLFAFGLLVLAVGIGLPNGLDAAFSYAVGTTLVVLGGLVLYQLGRDRGDYRYAGRITVVVGALRRGWARARRRELPGLPRGHGSGEEARDVGACARAGHLQRGGHPVGAGSARVGHPRHGRWP